VKNETNNRKGKEENQNKREQSFISFCFVFFSRERVSRSKERELRSDQDGVHDARDEEQLRYLQGHALTQNVGMFECE